jgi:hypothetical protein
LEVVSAAPVAAAEMVVSVAMVTPKVAVTDSPSQENRLAPTAERHGYFAPQQ